MKIPAWFWTWARWWRGHAEFKPFGPRHKPVRPDTAPRRIPFWAWLRLTIMIAGVKPPVDRQDPFAILSLPTLYVCWGLENGQYSPLSLVLTAKANGFKALCLQATARNLLLFREVQIIAYDHGMKVGLWHDPYDVFESIEVIDRAGTPDFFDAQVEKLADWPTYFVALRTEFPHLPIAVVTNFWGFIRPENQTTFDGAASYAVALGVACRPEAYLAEAPTLTPERVHYTARRLGWPDEMIFPLVSVYPGPNGAYRLGDYNLSAFKGWGAYTAEYL